MKNINKLLILLILISGLHSTTKAIDCDECCKAGRSVSTECCRDCHGCCIYNDEACAECKDIPA